MNLTDLDESAFSTLLGVVSDVSLTLSEQGVIEEVSTGQETMAALGTQGWLGKRWSDIVTVESKQKIQD
ncbi:MAG: hypothetical protein WAO62_06740 [Burkholderiaceae bacterium]